jgi:hypothetical protein
MVQGIFAPAHFANGVPGHESFMQVLAAVK